MAIKFDFDWEITTKFRDIVEKLEMKHVDVNRVICMRSHGSGSARTIARCYALSKIWQLALNTKAHYIIEVISEKYDRLSEADKEKTMIHEILHIPNCFGGGFKHHGNWVTRERVERLHREYISKV
jgi:predicted metallopeptidase